MTGIALDSPDPAAQHAAQIAAVASQERGERGIGLLQARQLFPHRVQVVEIARDLVNYLFV